MPWFQCIPPMAITRKNEEASRILCYVLLIMPAGGWLWVSSNVHTCAPSTWHAIHMLVYIDISPYLYPY
eukprot:10265627-Ditylum_brightwellii.AAC.3